MINFGALKSKSILHAVKADKVNPGTKRKDVERPVRPTASLDRHPWQPLIRNGDRIDQLLQLDLDRKGLTTSIIAHLTKLSLGYVVQLLIGDVGAQDVIRLIPTT